MTQQTQEARNAAHDAAAERRTRLAESIAACGIGAVPFSSSDEAVLWFARAQEARRDGARFSAGKGEVERPCEPLDILSVIDRLWRSRRLLRDHLMVLAHYARRQLPPVTDRRLEMRAHTLWREAMAVIDPVLRAKGIVR